MDHNYMSEMSECNTALPSLSTSVTFTVFPAGLHQMYDNSTVKMAGTCKVCCAFIGRAI